MVSTVRKVVCVACLGFVAVCALGDSVPAGTVADIEERTKPFGELCLEGDDCGGVQAPAPVIVQAAGRSGAEVYALHCHVCHDSGLNDAPKFGDAEAWQPRLEKGMEELLRTTKEGLNLMPPMGTCMTCTDAELRAAIEHTTGVSGGGN
ncbi:MAG: c-type cytochrome [Gammaproteobacteria bacterium]|nr:c-type cytochrome [Gammaproteobacteria bacterium]